MTVIISSTVQSFFAWRVNKLTGRRWLYILLNISSFVQFRKSSEHIFRYINLTLASNIAVCGMLAELLACAPMNIEREIRLGLGTTIGCSIVKDFANFQSFQSVVRGVTFPACWKIFMQCSGQFWRVGANNHFFLMKVIVWLTLSAVTDIVIAGVMVQYLRGHRTGISQTEDLLTKIIKCEYHFICDVVPVNLIQFRSSL